MSKMFLHSGRVLDFNDIENAKFEISDIAHALSNMCRFNGHVKQYYSVAQHCVLVSHMVPAKHALVGLLHDAAEAFMSDMVRPLKDLFPDYVELEDRLLAQILKQHGFSGTLPKIVKDADDVLLAAEILELTVKGSAYKRGKGNTPPRISYGWTPGEAYEKFMARYGVLVCRGH